MIAINPDIIEVENIGAGIAGEAAIAALRYGKEGQS